MQGSQSLYSGVGQGSVIRCSSPVKDHDFVPASENFEDSKTHGSYVAPIPGRPSTVQSASITFKSKGLVVDTPQPLPTASGVLAAQTPPTQGQLPHLSTPAGPAPHPAGSQHASSRGASLRTMHLDQGDDHVARCSAQSSDLQSQGIATQTPITQGHDVAVSSGGTPSAAHLNQPHVNIGYDQTTHYPCPPGCQPVVSPDGTPLGLFVPQASNFGYPAPVVLPQPSYFREEGGGGVARVQPKMYEPRETQVHFLTPTPRAQQQPTEHNLAPVTSGGTSRHTLRSHGMNSSAPRSKLKYKDLQYDGKTSWKAYLHKFVRLSHNQQWTKTEQHDFCLSLEGPASDYYTLLLKVCPRLRFCDILTKFDKRFGTSAPDLTHQLHF